MRRTHLRVFGVAALSTALLVTSMAVSPGVARADAADDLFQAGRALYDEGKLEAALEKYTAAWKLKQSADIAGNLGQLEFKLGHYRDAAEHLAYSVRTMPVTSGPEKRQKTQALLDEAKAKVCVVRVTTSIDGATIVVNGKPVGAAPLAHEIYVDPGPADVSANLSGHTAKPEHLELTIGSARDVYIVLTAAGGTVPDDGGELPMWPGIVGLGVGAVAMGVGVGLFVVGDGKISDGTAAGAGMNCDPAAPSPACAEIVDTLDSGNTLGNVGIPLMITGGVALAFGAVWTIASATQQGSAENPSATWLLPSIGPTEAGLQVGGSF